MCNHRRPAIIKRIKNVHTQRHTQFNLRTSECKTASRNSFESPTFLREALLRSEALKLNCVSVCLSVYIFRPFYACWAAAVSHAAQQWCFDLTNFRNPEKSAHKLALRGESSTFEDPVLDHFLDTFFEHFPRKAKLAIRATRLRAVV